MTWREQALCSSVDPEVFFPERGDGARQAKRICGACPVRSECLAEALGIESAYGVGLYGIWGGTSPEQRRKMLDPVVLPRDQHGTRAAYIGGCRCNHCVRRQRVVLDDYYEDIGFVPSLRLPVGVA